MKNCISTLCVVVVSSLRFFSSFISFCLVSVFHYLFSTLPIGAVRVCVCVYFSSSLCCVVCVYVVRLVDERMCSGNGHMNANVSTLVGTKYDV